MLPDHLLPANSTTLEQELSRLSVPLDRLDAEVLATIWDAWRCPAVLLPWLAWALSVDHWDADWDEVRKRQSIADSPAYHRRKGTVSAVETAVSLSGYPYQISEWWQRVPAGRRGTAIIHIDVPTERVVDVFRRVWPLLMTSKPKSRPVFLGVGEQAHMSLHVGAGLLEETLITIQPYAYVGENAEGAVTLGAGLLDETLTTIEAIA
jgi:phage tail P2-like protein